MDWLTRHAKSQSFEDSKLTLQSRFDKEEETEVITLFPLTELQREKASFQIPTLSTARTVIPPRSGVHVQVKLPESSGIPNGALVLLERIAGALPAHLAIGNSVSIVEDRELTLNVINVSKKHAAILKGRPLALATLYKNILAEQEEAERNEDRAKTTGCRVSAAATGGTQGTEGFVPNKNTNMTEEERKEAEKEIDKAVEGCIHLLEQQRKELRALFMEYTDLFPTAQDPGTFKGVEARVEVEPGTIPMYSRPRMVPHAMRAELCENLQKLLDAGVIAPTSSPWGFSLVLVRKKNGKLHICIDYRRLNNALKKDRHPLPRLDHTLAKLQGKRWFSSLDLYQGFYQVPVQPSDRNILVFVTADGQYTYLKMPMGISTAPSIFQRSMDVMLAGMGSFVNVYLDDVLVAKPVLRHPDFDRDFLVKPDASSDAIGAVLAQKDEEGGHEHPIAFASRTMTDLEKKWSIMEREALALVYAVDVFKAYLYGRRFTVITDHRSLQHIHTQKDCQPRVMRWSLKLAIYEFEVQHRAGASHLNADAMSRPPIAQLSEAPKPDRERASDKLKRPPEGSSDSEEDEIVVAACESAEIPADEDMEPASGIVLLGISKPVTVAIKKSDVERVTSLPFRVAVGKKARAGNANGDKKVVKQPAGTKKGIRGSKASPTKGSPAAGPQKSSVSLPSLSVPLCTGKYSREEFQK
uniref:Reverse transcriptase n=1 Tax=Chromera velia CCMP2878 TaxID=1169474 RepID=A0A0G4HED5_9ALVE|eukprot:Cvel_26593.t1-p1 / transcript=Cvel_26593.t1 / gene=Cvel_26593 / organism=Chromera_velia_CCMP2878 / gene_product=Transposon Ty3-I Gag-Pol polyprotein, putative / transcript_product=Transposon Ty3-I Gag-Pol polyprotein, putative / location=Cvel_scaffold3186:3650-6106(+) / protein_length=695 / sequence_SO=supercontig / SO=protein_coding / is_pseudo=false